MSHQDQTKEIFCIDDLLRELQKVVKENLQIIGKSNIDVRIFQYRKHLSCHILAERERIRQAFVHLLENSIKYTVRGHIVFGYYVLKPDLVDFFVDDTGTRMYYDTEPDLYAVRDLLQQTGIRLKERKPNDISAKYSFSVTSEQVKVVNG
jgi:light-regulated signal transduction histidine kinase (bacteriophytochrome)